MGSRSSLALLGVGLAAAALLPACVTPASEPGLPLDYDFSSCSDWAVEENESFVLGCDDGAYRMLLEDPRDMQTSVIDLGNAVEALSVEADAVNESGPNDTSYGVSCWASDGEGYVFLVTSEAGWAILKRTEEETVTLARDYEQGAVESFSDTNRIRGECTGGERATAALSVNGEEVGRAEDSDGFPSFGIVGVSVVTLDTGAEVRFDNFAADELEASAQPGGAGSESPEETKPAEETAPTTTSESSADGLCKREGIRYSGETRQGAEVCFTLSPDGDEWVEIGFAFVDASGCRDSSTGTVYAEGPVPLAVPRRINESDFTARIRGAQASGVIDSPEMCPGKTFKWTARRQP